MTNSAMTKGGKARKAEAAQRPARDPTGSGPAMFTPARLLELMLKLPIPTVGNRIEPHTELGARTGTKRSDGQ